MHFALSIAHFAFRIEHTPFVIAMKKTLLALASLLLAALPAGAVSVSYVDEHGAGMGSASCTAITGDTTTMGTGWYAVTSNTSNPNRIEVSGNANLILCDGATLAAPKGIHLTGQNSLTVWGQNGGTGALVIESPDEYNAGIGGNRMEDAVSSPSTAARSTPRAATTARASAAAWQAVPA